MTGSGSAALAIESCRAPGFPRGRRSDPQSCSPGVADDLEDDGDGDGAGQHGLGSAAAAPAPRPPRRRPASSCSWPSIRCGTTTCRASPPLHRRLPRLTREGAVFTNAHLDHYPSVTAVGPLVDAHRGPTLDQWHRRKRLVRPCPEEERHERRRPRDEAPRRAGWCRLVPAPPRVSTVGDELKMAHPGSRVIGISHKDRSAILMAGRAADLALWWDTQTGAFVSSTWYAPELPKWAADFNASRPADAWLGREWRAVGEGGAPCCGGCRRHRDPPTTTASTAARSATSSSSPSRRPRSRGRSSAARGDRHPGPELLLQRRGGSRQGAALGRDPRHHGAHRPRPRAAARRHRPPGRPRAHRRRRHRRPRCGAGARADEGVEDAGRPASRGRTSRRRSRTRSSGPSAPVPGSRAVRGAPSTSTGR